MGNEMKVVNRIEVIKYGLTANVVHILMERNGWPKEESISKFIMSRVYECPQNEEMKVWHCSPMQLAELSEIVGIKRETLGKIIIKLQQEGVLAREGSKRSGSWKVMQNNNTSEPKNEDA